MGSAGRISTHAPLARCDVPGLAEPIVDRISTHAPLARCDSRLAGDHRQNGYFNSRTSCEVRQRRHHQGAEPADFNSRTSCEVRLVADDLSDGGLVDFNSRTSCEVRQAVVQRIGQNCTISTHAPLARCDSIVASTSAVSVISTHAPHARCDESAIYFLSGLAFQLTHLLRGATSRRHKSTISRVISTHAPLARCDYKFFR